MHTGLQIPSTGTPPDSVRACCRDSVKAAVCKNINLFMQHNEEEVAPYLETYVRDVWQLLMSCSLTAGQDRVAITAIAFLTSIARTVHYKLFAAQDILTQVRACLSATGFCYW